MTTFDDRERAYENKLVHDEAMKFKATVRRNRWLGLWAAAKLGKNGAAADDYATEIVAAEIDGNDAVFKKLRADFNAGGVRLSDHQIHREMDELFARASQEVMTVVIATKP